MTLLNNIHAVKECQDIPACHASAIVNASRQPAHRLISENNTGMDAHRVKSSVGNSVYFCTTESSEGGP